MFAKHSVLILSTELQRTFRMKMEAARKIPSLSLFFFFFFLPHCLHTDISQRRFTCHRRILANSATKGFHLQVCLSLLTAEFSYIILHVKRERRIMLFFLSFFSLLSCFSLSTEMVYFFSMLFTVQVKRKTKHALLINLTFGGRLLFSEKQKKKGGGHWGEEKGGRNVHVVRSPR